MRPVKSSSAWALVCWRAPCVFFCLSSDETGGCCIDAVALAPPPQRLLRPPPLRFVSPFTIIAEACFHGISPLSPRPPPNHTASLIHPTLHYTPQLPLFFTAKIALKTQKNSAVVFPLCLLITDPGKRRTKRRRVFSCWWILIITLYPNTVWKR